MDRSVLPTCDDATKNDPKAIRRNVSTISGTNLCSILSNDEGIRRGGGFDKTNSKERPCLLKAAEPGKR